MSLVRAPLVGEAAVARSARARDRCQFGNQATDGRVLRGSLARNVLADTTSGARKEDLSVRDGLIDLPDVAELLDELLTVRVVETSAGLLSIDTRPDLHDDMTDALGICALRLLERPEPRPGYAVTMAARTIGVDFGVPEAL
jgi:hypothetical protein